MTEGIQTLEQEGALEGKVSTDLLKPGMLVTFRSSDRIGIRRKCLFKDRVYEGIQKPHVLNPKGIAKFLFRVDPALIGIDWFYIQETSNGSIYIDFDGTRGHKLCDINMRNTYPRRDEMLRKQGK